MAFDPFSVLTSKIFGGLAVVALAGLAVQTVRIEGALCRQVELGEKPACVIQGFKQQISVLRIDLDKVRRDRELEAASHRQTKDSYRAAQAEAEQLERERLARVSAQQKEITDEVAADFERRLADARARAERLRGKAAASGAGAAGARPGQPMPGAGDAAGRADEAARDPGLSLDERLIATEQALQLDALIDWLERQAKVERDGR